MIWKHIYFIFVLNFQRFPFYSVDDTSCGIGRQKRMADCVRSDGKIVHPFYCRVEGRRVPTLLRVCTVLCPRNCEISEWGAWSSCQNQCNTISVRRRSRFILAPAKNGGQSCLESDPLQGNLFWAMISCMKIFDSNEVYRTLITMSYVVSIKKTTRAIIPSHGRRNHLIFYYLKRVLCHTERKL